jgi:putative transposase
MLRGLRQYWMILFIRIGTRRITVTPATEHPTGEWVSQQARKLCMHVDEENLPAKRLIRDGDAKFCCGFDRIVRDHGMKVLRLRRRSPDLNGFAERAIRSIKHEWLNHFMILGERHLNHLVQEYVDFHNRCRPYSARDDLPPCWDGPPPQNLAPEGIRCEVRLGGLLRHYYREAA